MDIEGIKNRTIEMISIRNNDDRLSTKRNKDRMMDIKGNERWIRIKEDHISSLKYLCYKVIIIVILR